MTMISVTRDPLVNPEKGDVVRATRKKNQGGAHVVFVVTRIADDRVRGTATCVDADDDDDDDDDGYSVYSVPFVRELATWADWSEWDDVEVLS